MPQPGLKNIVEINGTGGWLQEYFWNKGHRRLITKI